MAALLQLVDNEAGLASMLKGLSAERILAIDAEGLQLCRDGKVCLLIVATPDGRVWIVDICALGDQAFTHKAGASTLKSILESPAIEKLM